MPVVLFATARRGIIVSKIPRGVVASPKAKLGIVGFPRQGKAGRNGGFTWIDATTDQTLEVGKAYKANSVSQIVFEFTGLGVFGDQIKVQAYGFGGFQITVPVDVTVKIAGSPNVIGDAIFSQYHESDSVLFTCLADNEIWIAETFGCTPNLR